MASGLTMLRPAHRGVERLFEAEGGSVAGLDDPALWERFAARGDEAAFAALVERHGGMVLRTARGVLGDHHAAEDAFQATFVALARRGGTIREGGALGPWLHRVAVREAARLRARRRRQEARDRAAGGRAEPAPPDRAAVHAAVHAELDRLPATYRLPIVLCDLEGWTKASAAAHLGTTEGAVRGRLERGRHRLRDRLARRGFAPAALGSAATLLGPTAEAALAVAPRLVARAAGAALAAGPVGRIGALVASLASVAHPVAGLRGLVAVGTLGAVALLGAAGWSAWFARAAARPGVIPPAASSPQPPGPATPPPAPAVALVSAAEQPGDLVPIPGRVVDPAGKPVGGATVRLKPYIGALPVSPETRVTADAAGRFVLPVGRHLLNPSAWSSAEVVGQAPGWGLGYASLGISPVPADGLTVRLVPDDAPLEGRIVDLEGVAVARATVRVGYLYTPTTPDLTEWAAGVRREGAQAYWSGQDGVNARQLIALGEFADLDATTDAAGRFRLAGVGRERLADLIVSARNLATTQVHATTQTRGPIEAPAKDESERTLTIHASHMDFALPPGRTVEGTIRDADTGAPLAGIPVQGQVGEEGTNVWLWGIEAVSDAQGHYRLDGFPLADRYRVFVRPTRGQPYLRMNIPTPIQSDGPTAANLPFNAAGRGVKPPIVADLSLPRAVLVRGRLIDKTTGKPLISASVQPYARRGTPEEARFTHLDRTMAFCRTDVAGNYEVATMPGPGLLTVAALGEDYPYTHSFEAMEGYDPKTRLLSGYPHALGLWLRHAVVPIQVEAGSSPTVDLTVERGGIVRGRVLDPAGQPLPGAVAQGLTHFEAVPTPIPTAEFEAKALDPAHPRSVLFFHQGRQLVAQVELRGDEGGPVEVRLAPGGSVTGRLVDDRGEPLVGSKIYQFRDDAEKSNWGRIIDGNHAVGEDGRFRLDGLIPGQLYTAHFGQTTKYGGVLMKDFKPEAGVTVDLGDIKPEAGKE